MQITAPHTVSAAPKITSIKRYSIIASSMETKELKQRVILKPGISAGFS